LLNQYAVFFGDDDDDVVVKHTYLELKSADWKSASKGTARTNINSVRLIVERYESLASPSNDPYVSKLRLRGSFSRIRGWLGCRPSGVVKPMIAMLSDAVQWLDRAMAYGLKSVDVYVWTRT
jgi:hypothetical protein